MIAQYRPDIARVAEETVVNLKEVENRMEALKNDLAWLCTSIGHPEAARVAAAPTRALGFSPYATPFGATQSLGFSPFLGQIQPFGNLGLGAQIPSAYGIPPFGLGIGFGQPIVSPTAAFAPYPISPAAGVGFGIPGLGNVPAAFGLPFTQVGTFAQNPTIPVR